MIYDADIAVEMLIRLPTAKIYKSLTFADIYNTCDTLRSVLGASTQPGSHSDRNIDGKIDAKLKKGVDHLAQVDRLIGHNTVHTLLPTTVADTDHGDVVSLNNPHTTHRINIGNQQTTDCRYQLIYPALPVLNELFKRLSQATITCVKIPLSTHKKTHSSRHHSKQFHLFH